MHAWVDGWVSWVWFAHNLLMHTFCQTTQKPAWMATPESRAARAKEMAERPDRECPLAEQVPNESFWADQPGSHGLPSDVETEHWRLVVNHSFGHFFDCSASVPVYCQR